MFGIIKQLAFNMENIGSSSFSKIIKPNQSSIFSF